MEKRGIFSIFVHALVLFTLILAMFSVGCDNNSDEAAKQTPAGEDNAGEVANPSPTAPPSFGAGTPSKHIPVPPTGKYGAVMEYDWSHVPAQTVYRPRDMGSMGDAEIPIVAWGNGGCAANGGSVARPFLMELASHGYLCIAPGRPPADLDPAEMTKIFGPQPVPGQPAPPAPERPPMPPRAPQLPEGADLSAIQMSRSTAADLIKGIDWAVQENSRPGSIYFNRIDVSKIAVMGHSCGGLQSIEVMVKDPRVNTAIVWNSGILNRQPEGMPGGMSIADVTKDSLKELNKPIAYIQGGPVDIAYENALDDFERIDNAPIFMGEYGVGHGGTFLKTNGGVYAGVALGWLDWQLKGDRTAGAMFSGKDCGLCTRPYWKVYRKQMD